jgi:hypothetical protein
MEQYRRPGSTDPDTWFVLDARGVLQGRFVRPDSVRILDSGSNWLLGVTTDSMGVEFVHLFSLVRR